MKHIERKKLGIERTDVGLIYTEYFSEQKFKSEVN